MKMTKQEQRKVTQDMLRILTLWRKISVGIIEEALEWMAERKRGKGGGKYQFTALLRKLAHQDLIGGGICHAPWVQRHLLLLASSCSGCNLQGGLLLLLLLLLLDAELLLLLPHIDLPRFCQLPSDVSPHAPFTP